MRQAVDFLQFPDADVGVNLGGLEAGLPELLLDMADVGRLRAPSTSTVWSPPALSQPQSTNSSGSSGEMGNLTTSARPGLRQIGDHYVVTLVAAIPPRRHTERRLRI